MGAKMMEKNNPQWKGNKVGYSSLHEWIINRMVGLKICANCNSKKSLDLANISGLYKRDINDYKWLCRKCHMESDGRMRKLRERNREFNNSHVIKRNNKGRFVKMHRGE